MSPTPLPRWVTPLRALLQQAIDDKRTTQTAFAKAAGVSQSAVSQFLDGGTKVPRADVLIGACKLFGLSIDHFVGLRGHEAAEVHAPSAEAVAEARKHLERFASALLLVSSAANHARRQTPTPRDGESDAARGTRTRR